MNLPFNDISEFQSVRQSGEQETLLGKGGFSQVILVTKENTDQSFAVKIIKKSNDQNSGNIRNEILIHSNLQHPNIVRLYQHFEDEENFYLIMEFQAKGNLSNFLKESCLSKSQKLNIFQ